MISNQLLAAAALLVPGTAAAELPGWMCLFINCVPGEYWEPAGMRCMDQNDENTCKAMEGLCKWENPGRRLESLDETESNELAQVATPRQLNPWDDFKKFAKKITGGGVSGDMLDGYRVRARQVGCVVVGHNGTDCCAKVRDIDNKINERRRILADNSMDNADKIRYANESALDLINQFRDFFVMCERGDWSRCGGNPANAAYVSQSLKRFGMDRRTLDADAIACRDRNDYCYTTVGYQNLNNWQRVNIEKINDGYRWNNKAGVSWNLFSCVTSANGGEVVTCNVSILCPYYSYGHKTMTFYPSGLEGPWGEFYTNRPLITGRLLLV